MKPRARIRAKTVAFTVLSLGVLAALGTGGYILLQPRIGGSGSEALGVPTPGSVRVVTTPVETGDDRLHYKWSLIGSSNWRRASGAGTDLALSDSYPLNSATDTGGCNVYEADLVAEKGAAKWTATLHGSDGTTINTEGMLPPGKSPKDVIRISQTASNSTVGTPTRITLAEIDGKPLLLSVAR